MNIVKRLLNVMSLVCVLVLCLGLNEAIDEYNEKRIERKESCETLTSLGAVKNGTDTNPFWKYLPDAEGKTIDEVIAKTKAQCEQAIDLLQPYGTAKTIFGSAAGLAVLIAVLNYIMIGKVTLWNKVTSSPKG